MIRASCDDVVTCHSKSIRGTPDQNLSCTFGWTCLSAPTELDLREKVTSAVNLTELDMARWFSTIPNDRQIAWDRDGNKHLEPPAA